MTVIAVPRTDDLVLRRISLLEVVLSGDFDGRLVCLGARKRKPDLVQTLWSFRLRNGPLALINERYTRRDEPHANRHAGRDLLAQKQRAKKAAHHRDHVGRQG